LNKHGFKYQPNRLSIFSLGYFLDPDITENRRRLAGKHGEIIFKHFGVIPSDFNVPECHCGEPLYRHSHSPGYNSRPETWIGTVLSVQTATGCTRPKILF